MHLYRFDAIVFDFDGTLVQSNKIKTWAFGELYKEHGEKIVQKIIDYNKEHEGIPRSSNSVIVTKIFWVNLTPKKSEKNFPVPIQN